MANTASDWMSSPVIVVDPDSSVKYALTLMRRRKIHSVVVAISDNNPQYGIVTSTDIRDKIAAAGRNPAEITVREIMSSPIITGSPEWTLMECSQVMQENHIHHLPIADERGALIGLISAEDLLLSFVTDYESEDSRDALSGDSTTDAPPPKEKKDKPKNK